MEETLLARLKSGSQIPPQRIKWPGTDDVEVGIRVLNDQDHSEIGLAVDALYKAAGIRISTENIEDYEHERTTQTLWRALVNPDDGSRLTKTIGEFRLLMRRGVREILVQEVAAWQTECSPNPDTMSAEEFDALLFSVKKNAAQTIGKVSNIFLLRRLIITLASPPPSLPADNGSI